MPVTYSLIASNTLSSSAASVTFSAIPATYTDLVLRFSARSDQAVLQTQPAITFNSDTGANYTNTYLRGDGTNPASGRTTGSTSINGGNMPGSSSTANTFGSCEIYIPSYTASQNKQISVFGVQETNATTAYLAVWAELWLNTSAINSISISLSPNNFVSGSSFFLYGIKNS